MKCFWRWEIFSSGKQRIYLLGNVNLSFFELKNTVFARWRYIFVSVYISVHISMQSLCFAVFLQLFLFEQQQHLNLHLGQRLVFLFLDAFALVCLLDLLFATPSIAISYVFEGRRNAFGGVLVFLAIINSQHYTFYPLPTYLAPGRSC